MGKVIKKKLNGMSWWMKASLVLLLTIATTMFMYQGWYKPMKAEAVTQAQAWSSLYSGIAVPGTLSYTVNAGSNRLLVVAVSSTMGGTAAAQTVTATYGGQTMTVVGNTGSARAHSYLLYLKDSGITAATNTNLIINLSGTTTSNYVYAAVYTSVDQTTPVSSTASWFSSASQSSIGPFSPALSIAANDQAVEIVNVMRSASGGTARTISTWATGWAGTFTPPAVNDSAAGWYTTMYVKDRTLLTANAGDTSQHTASSASSFSSMNAISIHDYTVVDVTPPVEGTISISPTDGTYTSATPTITMGFTDGESAISSCQYSLNGGAWTAATWTVGTGNCTQTLATQTNGTTVNIQMRATNAASLTSTPVATISRVVDTTGPTDGTLSITPASGSLRLDWTAATPTGSALNATTPYDVRFLAGGTAPTCTTGTSLYTGTALTYTHTGLTNGSTYSYRVCADDIFNNPSIGATVSGIPATNPSIISTCTACHFNPTAVAANGGSYDGTARNTPTGLFKGSHNKHANTGAMPCSDCHNNNTTITDYGHQNGTIDIAANIHSVSGETYTGGSHPVSNNPSFNSCTSYCHSLGTSKTSNSGETRTTTLSTPKTTMTWGTPNASGCAGCHGNPPDYPNNDTTWGNPKANSHSGTTHAAQACTVCHNSITGTAPNYTLTSTHADGQYNISYTGITYTYVSNGGSTCASTATGCHAGSTATWGKADCLGCHNSATLGAPEAAKIVATVTTRRDINAEFGNTANHVRSRGTAVTSADCAVCHMEGNISDGSRNTTVSPNSSALTTVKTYHGNGIIELRNVDTGTTILSQSFTSPATWADGTAAFFVRFKRNLAATPESETTAYDASTTNTVFAVNSAIQIKHCLTCHDTNGASVSFVSGGSASKPFGGAGNSPLNVASQLANTNRSYHPVIAKQNNGYAGSTVRMNAPWNGVNKTGATTVYGPLITCWDCHSSPTDLNTTITSTATAHGHAVTALAGSQNSVELVGRNWVTGAIATNTNTFCIVCHKGYDTSTTTNHGTGSAFSTGGSSSMSIWTRYGCLYCHSSSPNVATAARTTRAADVHGYDNTYAATAFTAGHGYAFIRSTILSPNHIVRQVGATTYAQTCGTGNITITNGTTSCSNGMGTYGVGGVY